MPIGKVDYTTSQVNRLRSSFVIGFSGKEIYPQLGERNIMNGKSQLMSHAVAEILERESAKAFPNVTFAIVRKNDALAYVEWEMDGEKCSIPHPILYEGIDAFTCGLLRGLQIDRPPIIVI